MTQHGTGNLTAGRELDALVAERVMGEAVARGVRCYYDCGSAPDDMGLLETERTNHYYGKAYDPVPHYSTSIASAWLVVEAMRAKDIGLSLIASADGWYCTAASDIEWGFVRGTDYPKITLVGGEHEQWQAFDSAPLAICVAALTACEPNVATPPAEQEKP